MILKSWSCTELTINQLKQYAITRIGDSFHSGRKTFKIVCTHCGKTLHTATNNPTHYIEIHDEYHETI